MRKEKILEHFFLVFSALRNNLFFISIEQDYTYFTKKKNVLSFEKPKTHANIFYKTLFQNNFSRPKEQRTFLIIRLITSSVAH